MTILMTTCPYCSSNFMLLDTASTEGKCAQCSKTKSFTEQEIVIAETHRDSLTEKYVSRLEKAYKEKDYQTLSSLVEEVAKSGISSWYAWFCIGWYDLHEGNIAQAFDDFKLAALFLDEENFDEFYELTMESVLESLEETVKKDKDWVDENVTLVDFTSTLFEHFEHLCEDGDFMCDLMYRIGTIEIETAVMGGNLLKEIMMLVLDYYAGNAFIPDQQQLLNNAIASVETIDAAMQEKAQDKTMSPNMVKILGSGLKEHLETIQSYNDEFIKKYEEEDMLALCEYWGFNDYETIFFLFQSSFEYHMGYITSGKRNKGIMKKRDKALDDFSKAFIRPLEEGLTDQSVEYEEDYDRICPDCGKPLKADENGLMQCECGFKSRMVTADIENLPENVPELIIMGRKAYKDRDPVMLNNIGERILEFDEDNWYGCLTLSSACAVDGELAECMMLAIQACENLPLDGVEEYSERVVEDVCSTMLAIEDKEDLIAAVMIPSLIETFESTVVKDKDIPMHMVGRLLQGTYDSSVKGFMAELFVHPTLVYELRNYTSLVNQRAAVARLIELSEKIQQGVKGIKDDRSSLKSDLINVSDSFTELLRYLRDGIDSRLNGVGVEKIGYMAGYWKANMEEYQAMIGDLSQDLMDDNQDLTTANAMKKTKHKIDAYLDEYMGAAEL